MPCNVSASATRRSGALRPQSTTDGARCPAPRALNVHAALCVAEAYVEEREKAGLPEEQVVVNGFAKDDRRSPAMPAQLQIDRNQASRCLRIGKAGDFDERAMLHGDSQAPGQRHAEDIVFRARIDEGLQSLQGPIRTMHGQRHQGKNMRLPVVVDLPVREQHAPSLEQTDEEAAFFRHRQQERFVDASVVGLLFGLFQARIVADHGMRGRIEGHPLPAVVVNVDMRGAGFHAA